jgi:poly-gamma-glutamate synthesis protein (capsule biosynthesis protein)
MKSKKNAIFSVILFLVAGSALIGVYFFFYGRQPITYHREEAIDAVEMYSATSTQQSVRLLFVGDMMFDRYIRKMAIKYGEEHLFSCINPLLQEQDMVIGNLEGPITSRQSTSMDTKIGSPENYYFTFPTSTAKLLFDHNIKLVNIGNNHINNQRREGVVETKAVLQKAGVGYFGGLLGDEIVYRETIHGISFSFISYNQFGGKGEDVVVANIKSEKELGRVVIVYAHWGEEYQDVRQEIRLTAKHFAESGADLIIGSHPHIVQSHELIGTVLVYYSLGNFIFDQYFQKEVMEGLALSVEVSPDKKITIKEHPVVIYKDGRTCPKSDDASKQI